MILPFGGEWSVSVAATAKGTAQHGSPCDYCMYVLRVSSSPVDANRIGRRALVAAKPGCIDVGPSGDAWPRPRHSVIDVLGVLR